ncbi:putative membrane protein [Catenulispora sp. GP43]|uniref:DUF1648 domain-containing protein n=1 Tax=Catenulispora sp. GP43 TaxID=3156263 RepID=UPI0035134B7C
MHANAVPAVLPVLLIGFLSLLTPLLTPRSVQFGVRVPAERADDPVVAQARRTYWTGIGAVTAVAVLAGLFVASAGAAGIVAMLVELAGSVAVYLLARSHVADAKRDGHWFEGRRQVTVTDTTLRTRPEPFPWLWALPAVAITVGTAVVGAVRYPHLPARLVSHYDIGGHPTSYADKTFLSAFGLVMVQVGITALIVALSWITARGKAELDAQDPHAAERHRRFVTAMARCLLVLAAAVDLTMFFAALAMWKLVGSTGLFPVLLLAPIVLATAGLIVVTVRIGQGGSRLRFDGGDGDRKATGPGGVTGTGAVTRDDDRFWKLGMIYINREDPAVFVQKRFGVGWTVNFGRPAAVGLLVGILAIAVLVPVLAGSH